MELKIAGASGNRKIVIKFLSLRGRGLHSSEAAFFLLRQRPRVRFSTSPKIYCYDVEIYTWPWLEKSRLRLENVDQTHLVLASDKLVLRKRFSRFSIKSEDQHWFYFLRMEKKIKNLRHHQHQHFCKNATVALNPTSAAGAGTFDRKSKTPKSCNGHHEQVCKV